MNTRQIFDALVVGAGHAGVEAALSIARAGYPVCLVTMDKATIAKMSCNPAIGGLAKGHIVREIDALGGEMAKAIDATGIQFRMLNRSKGPAVWAPRAQADKKQYSLYMQRVLDAQANVTLKQAQGTDLLVQNGVCDGIRTKEGEEIHARTVILTTGTFLQGLIHVGETHYEGGRTGEKPAIGLSASLKHHGIELVRFKTGTPPRLLDSSINWDVLEEQKGEEPPQPFSFQTQELNTRQISCYMTYTNAQTHQIIRSNLHRSPLYAGRIKGIGPRYCPSIEDKVVKFAEKPRHQIYLEPEGLDTNEIYVNGVSTSLPEDVQHDFIHTIPGLENAEFVRPGYAIEYDCAPPTQLWHTLETKKIQNLYLAGQINCTSGYEEAAGQGLMAGLNVIRKLRNEAPFVLDRTEAYLGVLIDDLVTRGTNEPYRMLTSRAEYRLLLRQDNADERLMKYGYEFGLIPEEVYTQSLERTRRVQNEIKRLNETWYENKTLAQHLRKPGTAYLSLRGSAQAAEAISNLPAGQTGMVSRAACDDFSPTEILQIETEVKYAGYISRQLSDVKKFKRIEWKPIPGNLNYFNLKGISKEAIEKLARVRPTSFGQASRIPGISNCDLSLLAVYIERDLRK